MAVIYGYGDSLHINRRNLWALERVPCEEAEPFEVDELPRLAARVDGGARLLSWDEAIARLRRDPGAWRAVFWRLASHRNSYEVMAVVERPAYAQDQRACGGFVE